MKTALYTLGILIPPLYRVIPAGIAVALLYVLGIEQSFELLVITFGV